MSSLIQQISLKEPLLIEVKKKKKQMKEKSWIRPKRMAHEGLTMFPLNIF